MLTASACLLALSLAAPRPAAAFRNVEVGATIRDRDLADGAGGKTPLLGGAKASVFVVFRSDSDNSYAALRELFFLEKEFAGKGVRFVAVASDADDLEAARAMLRRAEVKMPLLVDAGDALYGELGVRMHPVVGIVDGRGRLAADEPYRKVGFRQVVRGRIRVVLGELTPAQMEKLLSPPPSVTRDEHAPARRQAALARRELALGHARKAEEAARRGVELEPAFAPAHLVLGRALAAQGRCEEARKAVEEALRLAPGEAEAKDALKDCGAPRP